MNTNYPESTQQEILATIKAANKHESLTDCQATILFFWARHKDEPQFSFVDEYFKKNKAKRKKLKN